VKLEFDERVRIRVEEEHVYKREGLPALSASPRTRCEIYVGDRLVFIEMPVTTETMERAKAALTRYIGSQLGQNERTAMRCPSCGCARGWLGELEEHVIDCPHRPR
jgi:hypothetical protein